MYTRYKYSRNHLTYIDVGCFVHSIGIAVIHFGAGVAKGVTGIQLNGY